MQPFAGHTQVSHRRPVDALLLDVDAVVFFLVLAIIGLADARSRVAGWAAPLSMAWLALIAWVWLAARHPFTLGIARQSTPREMSNRPEFLPGQRHDPRCGRPPSPRSCGPATAVGWRRSRSTPVTWYRSCSPAGTPPSYVTCSWHGRGFDRKQGPGGHRHRSGRAHRRARETGGSPSAGS
jgi:hypothetical protein